MSILEQAKKAALSLKERVTMTPFERTLHEATNEENWNASTKVLQEIADHTYNFTDFNLIMKHIWKKMASDRKKWKKIIKSLTLIEYLLKNGSPRCIQETKDEIYQIRTLKDFAFSEEGVDRGIAIREKSKNILELISDESKLEEERENSKKLREKIGSGTMQAISSESRSAGGYSGNSSVGGGFGKKMEGFGSGSQGGSKSGQYGGYSNKDASSGGFGGSNSGGGGYDDARKTSTWRTSSKTEEKTISAIKEKKKEAEVEIKTKVSVSGAGGNGLKVLKSPNETKTEQQKAPVDLLENEDVNNEEGFEWDKAPYNGAKRDNENDEWSWENAEKNVAQPGQKKPMTDAQLKQLQADSNALGCNENILTQTKQPQNQIQNPSSIDIKSLYGPNNQQQQGVQGSRFSALDQAFHPQPQFNHPTQFQQQTWGQQQQQSWGHQQQAWGQQQAYPTNEFQSLNVKAQFISNPATTTSFAATQNTSTNLGQFDFGAKPQQSGGFDFQNNAPINQQSTKNAVTVGSTQKQQLGNQDDGFEDFQSAEIKKKSMFTGLESGLVDLGDMSKEITDKEKTDKTQNMSKHVESQGTFQLYSTKEDIDGFFDSSFGGMGFGAGKVSGANLAGGFGLNTNFGTNQAFQVNPTFSGGLNQGYGANVGMNFNQGSGGNQGFGINQGYNQPTGYGPNQGFQNYGNPAMNQAGYGYK